MNSRIRAWYRSHLPDDFLECILLRKHIKKVSALANHILNSGRLQVILEPHPINMTVSLHLEYEFINMSKAEAAVPTRICQKFVTLTIMCVSCLPGAIPMDGGPPALVIQEELERVEIVPELEM